VVERLQDTPEPVTLGLKLRVVAQLKLDPVPVLFFEAIQMPVQE
jgi:hypothetical protein